MVIEYCRPSWPGKHSPTPWKAQKTQKRFLTRMALSTAILRFGELELPRPRSIEERDPSRS
jgi:hypothetical protein